MKNKVQLLIGTATLILLMGAAYFAYDVLSSRVEPQNNLTVGETVPAADQEPAVSQEGDQGETTESKIPAPDFTVLDADGNEVQLSELFGKPIVLNFWASWCPPCKSEMPVFNSIYEEMGDTVTFMMVDLADGQRETMEMGAEYVAAQGFTFPVYYDTEGEAGTLYAVSYIPSTLFIDRDGYAVTGIQGALNEELLREGIELITQE